MSARPGAAQRSHKPTRPRRGLSWQERARCADPDVNPAIFHDESRYDQALAVCADCPVIAQCREFGKGQGPGVYGGRIQRGQPPLHSLRDLKPHGTVAAARRHNRAGEPLCRDCSRAAAWDMRERRRQQ